MLTGGLTIFEGSKVPLGKEDTYAKIEADRCGSATRQPAESVAGHRGRKLDVSPLGNGHGERETRRKQGWEVLREEKDEWGEWDGWRVPTNQPMAGSLLSVNER